MLDIEMPNGENIYYKERDNLVIFNQLAVKIPMDTVSKDEYYLFLDQMKKRMGILVTGSHIAEKKDARQTGTLNTAVYYDTQNYSILPTGALLRTSCNRITHAFCAFKMARDNKGVRKDHRHVFSGDEKLKIQSAPASDEAVSIVRGLLSSNRPENPALYLEQVYGICGKDLSPAILLDDYRHTFYVWIDGKDALRCSLDCATVVDLRLPEGQRNKQNFSEVEIAVFPRIANDVAKDRRVVDIIQVLSETICKQFSVKVTSDIKYQRAARILGLYK